LATVVEHEEIALLPCGVWQHKKTLVFCDNQQSELFGIGEEPELTISQLLFWSKAIFDTLSLLTINEVTIAAVILWDICNV
jgi:hypothetical protein